MYSLRNFLCLGEPLGKSTKTKEPIHTLNTETKTTAHIDDN